MSGVAYRKRLALCAVFGMLLFLAGVGGVRGVDARKPPAPAQRHVVDIRDFRFEPASLVAAVGDTVVWVNRDIVPHTATADSALWDSGTLQENESWYLVVQEGGVLSYHCRFHPSMRGEVIVQ